jgi:integrase
MDASLDLDPPRIRVRRAIVSGEVTSPKSRYGRRTIPISDHLAGRLAHLVECRDGSELLFRGAPRRNAATGEPAPPRADPSGAACRPALGALHTLRHTCAALLIEAGTSPRRLQRWMGHHSAAFTLDHYGHFIDGELGSSLDLSQQLQPR